MESAPTREMGRSCICHELNGIHQVSTPPGFRTSFLPKPAMDPRMTGWVGMAKRPGSEGKEGGRVVRGDGLSAEGDEVGVVGGGECVDGLAGGEGLPAEGFGFAALRGVEYEDTVGEGGDAGVAAGGGGGGGTAEAVGEGREEQEAAGGDGIAPRAGDAHVGETAGGADYDGWRRARGVGRSGSGLTQEEFKELFFDGGLEAADEGNGVGAQGAGEVVAFEDEVAGALD